jgi:bifunctional non-homologous end joining protein LigD
MDARFSPMLATAAATLPADADRYVLEPKFDGWRAIVHIDDDGKVTLYGGRNGKSYTGKVPYIENALAKALPHGTAIDGELIAPAGWGDVQGVMTRGVGKAHVPTAASPALTLVAFDCLFVNGNDLRTLSYDDRRAVLEMIPWPEHTHLTPNGPVSQEKHIELVELGMEGSVLKVRTSRYENSRSRSWLKLKTTDSEDCEIVGFEQGKNGRSGEVGAIVVKLPSGEETTASGMTDKVRADMLANPQDYLGKIVEIAHNGHQSSGKVRHPRFKRMRDDRTPAAAPRAPRPAGSGGGGGGTKMRAYNLMGEAKLIKSWRELNAGAGDAYERHFVHAGTIDDHIEACRAAMQAKGLPT